MPAIVRALKSAAIFGRLDAHGSDSYEITFIGGEYGQVRIHSYGLTFIKAGVFDEQGNLLAVDSDRTGDIVVTFYAPQTGRYRIVILNEAPVANPYFISTN